MADRVIGVIYLVTENYTSNLGLLDIEAGWGCNLRETIERRLRKQG